MIGERYGEKKPKRKARDGDGEVDDGPFSDRQSRSRQNVYAALSIGSMFRPFHAVIDSCLNNVLVRYACLWAARHAPTGEPGGARAAATPRDRTPPGTASTSMTLRLALEAGAP